VLALYDDERIIVELRIEHLLGLSRACSRAVLQAERRDDVAELRLVSAERIDAMRRDRIPDGSRTRTRRVPRVRGSRRDRRVLEELEGARSQLVAGQCNKRYYAATPRSRPPAIHRPKSDLCGQLCADIHVVPKTVCDIKVRPAAGREATSSSARFSETGFANEYPLLPSLPPAGRQRIAVAR